VSDDRPSIAELQGCVECVSDGCWTDAQDRLNTATPVLLEIAAAALALRDQATISAHTRAVLYRSTPPTDAQFEAIDRDDRKLAELQAAYSAALSKVRP
jgi:hypothetical protein